MNDLCHLIEKTYPIIKIEENNTFSEVVQKTFFFELSDSNVTILPGQFYMLHYCGSQKPISVSHYDGKFLGFTILKRGKTTGKMIEKAVVGDYVGLTGPLGTPFLTEKYENILLIGGGIGVAPLYYLACWLLKNTNKQITVLFGARSASLLTFVKALKNYPPARINALFYTDDGSGGRTGIVTDDLDSILEQKQWDTACICGPEIMMATCVDKIRERSKKINIQLSLERYMKCGIGLCGSCVLDDIGLRVCTDGPIFDYEILKKSKEFGKYHRDCGGVIEPFQ